MLGVNTNQIRKIRHNIATKGKWHIKRVEYKKTDFPTPNFDENNLKELLRKITAKIDNKEQDVPFAKANACYKIEFDS